MRYDTCLEYGFHTGATTFRRRALEMVGGLRTYYYWGEEWDLLVRMAQVGKMGYVSEPANCHLCRESGSITTIHNPEKYVSGADQCRTWRRTVAGLPASHKWALRVKERQWRLLAAQIYLESRGQAFDSLEHAVRSLFCVPSAWGLRSSIRSALHCLVPLKLR